MQTALLSTMGGIFAAITVICGLVGYYVDHLVDRPCGAGHSVDRPHGAGHSVDRPCGGGHSVDKPCGTGHLVD